jgi:hypothetical protein
MMNHAPPFGGLARFNGLAGSLERIEQDDEVENPVETGCTTGGPRADV